jgi:hypothetical protein
MAVAAVPVQHVHERTSEQDRVRQESEQMRTVLGDEKEGGYCEKSKQNPTRPDTEPSPITRSFLLEFHPLLLGANEVRIPTRSARTRVPGVYWQPKGVCYAQVKRVMRCHNATMDALAGFLLSNATVKRRT